MKFLMSFLFVNVLFFSSCSNSTKNENDKSNMVFIEDTVSGEFKEESEDFLPSDSVGVKDPKTGEYIMMTYEEAEKITESEKK
jgi:hypothetical protein